MKQKINIKWHYSLCAKVNKNIIHKMDFEIIKNSFDVLRLIAVKNLAKKKKSSVGVCAVWPSTFPLPRLHNTQNTMEPNKKKINITPSITHENMRRWVCGTRRLYNMNWTNNVKYHIFTICARGTRGMRLEAICGMSKVWSVSVPGIKANNSQISWCWCSHSHEYKRTMLRAFTKEC